MPSWQAFAVVAGATALMTALAVGGPGAGATTLRGVAPAAVPSPSLQVWYNRRTGVFHDAGCRFYLKTVDGRQLPLELAAQVGRPCHRCIIAPGLRAGAVRGEKADAKRIFVLP